VRIGFVGDLDDVLDTGRSALSITLSSCETTGWVTRITVETPRIARSMLSGESRSPGKISTPACARGVTFSATFSGWRTSTRTPTSRWAMRRAASEPTLPAVVTKITSAPPWRSDPEDTSLGL
jgi:hypothetical protein